MNPEEVFCYLFNISVLRRVMALIINLLSFQTSEAISISENMKNFLGRFCSDESGRYSSDDSGKAFSPVETYQLVDADNLDSFLESLRTNSMISKVSALYDEKDYDTVQVKLKETNCVSFLLLEVLLKLEYIAFFQVFREI
jgi:hypothetical protein